MSEEQGRDGINRRRMLRRASVVVAGTAAAGVAAQMVSSPANAAAGSPVVAGQDNDAGALTTSLTSSSASGTLKLATTSKTTDTDGLVYATAPLVLDATADYPSTDTPLGGIAVDNQGTLWVGAGGGIANYQYSNGNANILVPLTPQRVIDSRNGAAKTPAVLNGASAWADSVRLKAGTEIHIDLSAYSAGAYAVFGNITVTNAAADGFLQLYPYGATRPQNFSSINFTNKLLALSNSFLSGVGYEIGTDGYPLDRVTIYLNVAASVIIDITAFSAGGFYAVNPSVLGAAKATASAKDSLKAGKATHKAYKGN